MDVRRQFRDQFRVRMVRCSAPILVIRVAEATRLVPTAAMAGTRDVRTEDTVQALALAMARLLTVPMAAAAATLLRTAQVAATMEALAVVPMVVEGRMEAAVVRMAEAGTAKLN